MELVSPLTFGIIAALILFIVYMCIHRAEQFYGDIPSTIGDIPRTNGKPSLP
jgi:hypothetical protein